MCLQSSASSPLERCRFVPSLPWTHPQPPPECRPQPTPPPAAPTADPAPAPFVLVEEHWAQCERCDKWRRLPLGADPPGEKDRWYCPMGPDRRYASCDAPEETWVAVGPPADGDVTTGRGASPPALLAPLPIVAAPPPPAPLPPLPLASAGRGGATGVSGRRGSAPRGGKAAAAQAAALAAAAVGTSPLAAAVALGGTGVDYDDVPPPPPPLPRPPRFGRPPLARAPPTPGRPPAALRRLGPGASWRLAAALQGLLDRGGRWGDSDTDLTLAPSSGLTSPPRWVWQCLAEGCPQQHARAMVAVDAATRAGHARAGGAGAPAVGAGGLWVPPPPPPGVPGGSVVSRRGSLGPATAPAAGGVGVGGGGGAEAVAAHAALVDLAIAGLAWARTLAPV